MKYNEIGEALQIAGFSWQGAARAMGTSVSNLRNVAGGRVASKRIAKALCVLIDKSPAEAFPNHPRYAIDKEKEITEEVKRAKRKLKSAGLIAT